MNEAKLKAIVFELFTVLQENREAIINILVGIEPNCTANDELDRTLRLLINIDKQADFICSVEVNSIAVYLPQNQPLYSLFLFGIIPAFMSRIVVLRPPVLLRDQISLLSEIFSSVVDNYEIFIESRTVFFDDIVSKANVVIFTGKYINVLDLINNIDRNTLVIFNGSGSNPLIISETANLEIATIKCLRAQAYNSGQDCMAPKAIFVHRRIFNDFIRMLSESISTLKVGNYSNKDVEIGPLLSTDSFKDGVRLIKNNRSKILFGGETDCNKKIIYPTIIEFKTFAELPLDEIFVPVFRIVKYSRIEEVTEYLLSNEMRNHAAYVSYFGQDPAPDFHGYQIILNDTIESLDDGNEPFGGYGIYSSFVYCGEIKSARPVLVSEEIAKIFTTEGGFVK